MSKPCRFLFFLIFIVGFVRAKAQTPHTEGVVQGFVEDASGAAIAGATVTMESDTGTLATTTTDGTGRYQLQLPAQAGRPYRERITAVGFRSAVVEGVVVTAQATRAQDIKLQIGDTSQTVTVVANQTLGNGEIATEAQLGVLGNLDTFSTPFSVDSFTDALIEDQQAQNVTEVLQNIPGLGDANGRYSEDAYLQFRGFALDPGATLVNGIPFLVDDRSPALEDVAQVQLFKGPSSLINGTGYDAAPGGAINFVTKRATEKPLLNFDGGYSSRSDFEGHLDGGRRFFHDGIFGLRAQLGGRRGATPVDNSRDQFAVAAIEADVRAAKFRASLDTMETNRDMIAERGSIYLGNATAIPKAPADTSNPFNASTTFKKHNFFALGHVEYDPTAHIELFSSFAHQTSPETYQGPYSPSFANATGTQVSIIPIPYQGTDHSDVGRVGGRALFDTGFIHHQVTVSGDFFHNQGGTFFVYDPSLAASVDLYHPVNPFTVAGTHTSLLTSLPDNYDTHNNSFAAIDLMTLFDGRVVLIAGARDQGIRSANYGTISRGPNNTAVLTSCGSSTDCGDYSSSKVSPSGAGLVRIAQRFSVYANYIQDLTAGQIAPSGTTNAGQVFPPTSTSQQEIGAKYQFLHAGATLALFRIIQPNYNTFGPANATSFGVFGQQRNDGLEAEFFGNVASSVRLIGGFTLLDAVQQNTGDAATEGKRAQGVPTFQLTEGAEWTVPHARSLILTGRITSATSQYADPTQTAALSIPGWARLDIGGRYTLPIRFSPTLRVNVDNLTGHNYWASALQGVSYGVPRDIRISTGLRF